MTNPPYNNTAYHEPNKYKRYGALICGVIQIGMAFLMVAVGAVEEAAVLPTLGIDAFVGAILSIFAGGFGIQYSRTGNRCPTIASMVFSILACLVMFSVLVTNSILTAASATTNVGQLMSGLSMSRQISPEDEAAQQVVRVVLDHILTGPALACYGLMVFAGLVNFITCIVQSGFACGIVCDCCKPPNTNAYLANPAFHGSGYPGNTGNPGYPNNPYPNQGMQVDQQPQRAYDINMPNLSAA